mmetsp:Transcript_39361/g.87987  ORF Transcript_39361/g.87987 Transcript_39361/m.87987 type:complete len:368 (+) Transcript_39361:833-1936(+)
MVSLKAVKQQSVALENATLLEVMWASIATPRRSAGDYELAEGQEGSVDDIKCARFFKDCGPKNQNHYVISMAVKLLEVFLLNGLANHALAQVACLFAIKIIYMVNLRHATYSTIADNRSNTVSVVGNVIIYSLVLSAQLGRISASEVGGSVTLISLFILVQDIFTQMYPKFEGAAVWFYKKLGVAWCLLRLYETFGIAGLLAVLMRPCARGKSDKEKNVPLRRSSKSPMMDVIVEDGDSIIKPNEAPPGSSEEPRSKESRPFTVQKSEKTATKPKPFNLSSEGKKKNERMASGLRSNSGQRIRRSSSSSKNLSNEVGSQHDATPRKVSRSRPRETREKAEAKRRNSRLPEKPWKSDSQRTMSRSEFV